MHNKKLGIKAENYFASRMNHLGLRYSFEDDWFDFLVEGHKVEVKSCQLTIKQKLKRGDFFRSGRFDFTKKEFREKQFKEDIWICFILRYGNEFLLLGFVKAKELEKKRYITPYNLRKLKLLSLNRWLKKIIN